MNTTDPFETRFTQLSNGRRGLRSGLQASASCPLPSDSGGAAVVDFICSDETVDRYHEIVDPAGWELETYRLNPVFQNAHQHGDVLFTLGKALVTEVRSLSSGAAPRSSVLYQRVEFAVDANPVARVAYELYRGGFLNAVSVGFIPLKWVDGGPKDPWRRRYISQELVEVSAVGIPANPNALALALRSASVKRRDLLQALQQLCHRSRHAPVPGNLVAPVSFLRSLQQVLTEWAV